MYTFTLECAPITITTVVRLLSMILLPRSSIDNIYSAGIGNAEYILSMVVV